MDLLAKADNTTALHRSARLSLLADSDSTDVASSGSAIGAGQASLVSWVYAASAPEGMGGEGALSINSVTSGTCRVWCVVSWGHRESNIHFWGDSGYTKNHSVGDVSTPVAMQGEYCNFKVKFQPINGDLDTETTTICEGCIYIPIYGEPTSTGGSE